MLSRYLRESLEAASPLSCLLVPFDRLFPLTCLSLPVTHLSPTSEELAYKVNLVRRSLIYFLLIDSGKAWEMGKEALTFNLMPFGRLSSIICISVAFGRGMDCFCPGSSVWSLHKITTPPPFSLFLVIILDFRTCYTSLEICLGGSVR